MDQLSPQLMHKLVFTVLMHGLNDTQTNLALRLLTEAMSHSNAQIRELAIVAIADLSIAPVKRVLALTPGMSDESARVRRRVARALGDQGMAAQSAIEHLTKGLSDSDMSVRRDCAGAIGRLGPSAHSAAAGLIPMLTEPEGRTRAIAAVTLKRIGKAAVPVLLAAARTSTGEQRTACLNVLAKIAPDDHEVKAVLLRRIASDETFPLRLEDIVVFNGPPSSSGLLPAPAGV